MLDKKIELPFDPMHFPSKLDPILQQYKCKICTMTFLKEEITAWEIHKLNHTLVSLKNIIDRATTHGDRLY